MTALFVGLLEIAVGLEPFFIGQQQRLKLFALPFRGLKGTPISSEHRKRHEELIGYS